MKAWVGAAVLAMVAWAGAAAGQPLHTPAEALAQDAAEYAARFAVTTDEALRRLRAQDASVAATDRESPGIL